jgi:SOS regulatory protein LexA
MSSTTTAQGPEKNGLGRILAAAQKRFARFAGDSRTTLPPKGRLKQAMSVNTTMVLPLMGRIAAGQPIEAVQNNETISLADFVRSKEVFVLEVRGESMQDEHILDGDYVLVEKAKTAHNGDIVVALLDGADATLKRFYREGDKVRLQPSNASMKPIIVPAAVAQIQGRVIGVLRKY